MTTIWFRAARGAKFAKLTSNPPRDAQGSTACSHACPCNGPKGLDGKRRPPALVHGGFTSFGNTTTGGGRSRGHSRSSADTVSMQNRWTPVTGWVRNRPLMWMEAVTEDWVRPGSCSRSHCQPITGGFKPVDGIIIRANFGLISRYARPMEYLVPHGQPPIDLIGWLHVATSGSPAIVTVQ